jgi:urea transport system permease protein
MTLARLFRLAALGLILVLAAPPAWAEDLAAAVAALAGDSFAAKEKAIVALGKLGDPRAVPILRAMSDDRLRQAPDGRIVLLAPGGGTAKMTDAASGEELTGIAPDSLERIIVNNRLRGAIEAALGSLTLFSPDPAARLAAAQDVLKHPSPDAAALLEKAMAGEADPRRNSWRRSGRSPSPPIRRSRTSSTSCAASPISILS